MNEHPILSLMSTTIEKIKEMADSNTIVGQPINVAENVTIIPISKISMGFASGGSDFPAKNSKEVFGGGGGAGINVSPVAFIVVEQGKVRLLQLAKDGESIDRILNMIPDVVNQVSSLVKKDKAQDK